MPLECTFGLNHDYYLLIRTLVPLAIALVVLMLRRCLRASATHKRKMARNTGDNEGKEMMVTKAKANEALADQLLTFTFIIFYLIYPSNSANIFATFQCETLDDPEQSSFLRKDFKVDCKSSFHQYMMYYAAAIDLCLSCWDSMRIHLPAILQAWQGDAIIEESGVATLRFEG